jgi:hypothetical protein
MVLVSEVHKYFPTPQFSGDAVSELGCLFMSIANAQNNPLTY